MIMTFFPDYKYKAAVKNGLRMLYKIKNPVRLEPHGAVSFMDKVKREWDSFGEKGGRQRLNVAGVKDTEG